MEIDWEKLWIDAKKGTILDAKYRQDAGTDRWGRGAKDYRDSIQRNDYEYGRNVIDVIKETIKQDSEVLDIGAGPGTLAIPLAKMVKKVTALDPSKGMNEVLGKSAVAKGIENIEIINKSWQEIDDAEIRDRFNLVITSNVLWQFDDVGEQLMRIHDISRKHCCVILHAGLTNGLDSDLWFKIMNEEYNLGVDYIYLYNILYSKGIYANVQVIDTNHVLEKSVDAAIEYYERYYDWYTEINPRVKEIIKDHVAENAINGIYRREGKWKSAVMWWEK